MPRRRRPRYDQPSWRIAGEALMQALRERAGPDARIEWDRVFRLGTGMFREIHAADVQVAPDPGGLSDRWVVLLPAWEADRDVDARAVREAELLDRLAAMDLPFRVPAALGAYRVGGRVALVRAFAEGFPVDPKRGVVLGEAPWTVIGRVAAGVHGVAIEPFTDLLPGHPTRRAPAEAFIAEAFDGLGPEAEPARAWALAHLPPPDAPVLLHGDLLGQNILRPLEGGPPALIDWEFAWIGDPALDLAIVTRGARKPLGETGGLHLLLDAYREAGGADVTASEVCVHELCMHAQWYAAALKGDGPHGSEHQLRMLEGLMRRVEGGRGR